MEKGSSARTLRSLYVGMNADMLFLKLAGKIEDFSGKRAHEACMAVRLYTFFIAFLTDEIHL